MGPVALRRVGSSQTRARTCVPCIGRQTLNHCATREALASLLWGTSQSVFLVIFHFSFFPSSATGHSVDEAFLVTFTSSVLFFKKIFIYVIFFFGALGLSCGTWDLRCGTWDPSLWHVGSLLQRMGFPIVVVRGLQST